jgi:two-component system chemotaxis sensor kinase CheA
LQSVDCLRGLLEALQAKKEPDMQRANQLAGVFQAVLNGGTYAQSSSLVKVNAITGELIATQADEVTDDNISVEQAPSTGLQRIGFTIFFKPELGVLKSGNDPIRMLRELSTLGQMKTTVDGSELPPLQALVVDNCYLSWTIELLTACEIGDVEEVFEWVEGECDLSITPLLEDSTAAVGRQYQDQQNDSKMKDVATSGQHSAIPSELLPSLDDLQLPSYIEPTLPP